MYEKTIVFNWKYCVLCCVGALLSALCYFAYNQQWIIIQVPDSKNRFEDDAKKALMTKKSVKRIFWHNDGWHIEETDLLWSDDKAENLTRLINSWLTLLDEEKVMEKKVSLQSIVLSPSGHDVYCSFDRNPFNKNNPTYEKLMWIEGLLKTIRENGIKIQQMFFLVHHQPLHDFHLDFSNPWPVSGFVES
jgi:hypothetical protein